MDNRKKKYNGCKILIILKENQEMIGKLFEVKRVWIQNAIFTKSKTKI